MHSYVPLVYSIVLATAARNECLVEYVTPGYRSAMPKTTTNLHTQGLERTNAEATKLTTADDRSYNCADAPTAPVS